MSSEFFVAFGPFDTRQEAEERAAELAGETGYEFEVLETNEAAPGLAEQSGGPR